MKPIGLIGGTSWESTLEYYRLLNLITAQKLGQPHSAEIVMCSMDFAKVEALMRLSRWDMIAAIVIGYAEQLEAAGAGIILICSNTIHRIAEEVERECGLPLLHIADVTAKAVTGGKADVVGLLGTKVTMEGAFYSGRFRERHGIDTIIPGEAERAEIDRIIFGELIRGELRDSSRDFFRGVIGSLAERWAVGIVLGCTEIPLLVGQDDSPVPIYDTMRLHAAAAVEWSLA